MDTELAKIVLESLRVHGTEPMPEGVLVSSCKVFVRPRPTQTDVIGALERLERDGFIAGHSREITGRYWSLTPKGQAKAAEL